VKILPTDKPTKFKEAGKKAKDPIECLMKKANYEKGIDLLAAGDTAGLEALFTKCGVAPEDLERYVAQAKLCYCMPTSMW
jgi:hypothetical protein